jgi:hypothetical protein
MLVYFESYKINRNLLNYFSNNENIILKNKDQTGYIISNQIEFELLFNTGDIVRLSVRTTVLASIEKKRPNWRHCYPPINELGLKYGDESCTTIHKSKINESKLFKHIEFRKGNNKVRCHIESKTAYSSSNKDKYKELNDLLFYLETQL